MYCTRLAEIQDAQKSPSRHHRTTLSGCVFATKACIDNQKKNLLHSNISSTCPHNMANFSPPAAEICWRVWGTPANFITAATSLSGGQPNFARCLAVSWAGTLYIHFRELLLPGGILPRAKFALRLSLALSYIGSVIARHSSSGRQPNFAAWCKECNY